MNESLVSYFDTQKDEKWDKRNRSSDICLLPDFWFNECRWKNLTELKEERVCLVKNILSFFQDSYSKVHLKQEFTEV